MTQEEKINVRMTNLGTKSGDYERSLANTEIQVIQKK